MRCHPGLPLRTAGAGSTITPQQPSIYNAALTPRRPAPSGHNRSGTSAMVRRDYKCRGFQTGTADVQPQMGPQAEPASSGLLFTAATLPRGHSRRNPGSRPTRQFPVVRHTPAPGVRSP